LQGDLRGLQRRDPEAANTAEEELQAGLMSLRPEPFTNGWIAAAFDRVIVGYSKMAKKCPR